MWSLILQHKKIIGGITAILSILVLSNQIYDGIYEKGRLDAQIELQRQFNEQYEAQRKEYEKTLQKSLETISEDYEERLKLEREKVEIRYITEEVIKYVDREIKIPVGCESLADDVVSLLKQATNITSAAAHGKTRGSDKS